MTFNDSCFKHPILASLFIASIATVIMFGVGMLADYLMRTDANVRTIEECNQLHGLLKDDPRLKIWLESHPWRANDTQKQDCLDGLKMYDSMFTVPKYLFIPAGLIAFFLMYDAFRKSEVTKKE